MIAHPKTPPNHIIKPIVANPKKKKIFSPWSTHNSRESGDDRLHPQHGALKWVVRFCSLPRACTYISLCAHFHWLVACLICRYIGSRSLYQRALMTPWDISAFTVKLCHTYMYALHLHTLGYIECTDPVAISFLFFLFPCTGFSSFP